MTGSTAAAPEVVRTGPFGVSGRTTSVLLAAVVMEAIRREGSFSQLPAGWESIEPIEGFPDKFVHTFTEDGAPVRAWLEFGTHLGRPLVRVYSQRRTGGGHVLRFDLTADRRGFLMYHHARSGEQPVANAGLGQASDALVLAIEAAKRG